MEIRIHSQAGTTETFVQNDPALVSRLVDAIQPSRAFAADVITVAGDYSVTTFVTARINRIDVLTKEFADWKYPPDIVAVLELSEEEFRERSHLNDPARLEPRRTHKQAGQSALVFVEVELVGGTRIFLAAKIKVGLPAERLQRLRTLFAAPAVHFRLREGGGAILNLKNLVRFTLNPGPDVTPSDAWPAHHQPDGIQSRSGAEPVVLE